MLNFIKNLYIIGGAKTRFLLLIWFLFIFLYIFLKKYDLIQKELVKKEKQKKNYFYSLHLFGLLAIFFHFGYLLYDLPTYLKITNSTNIITIIGFILIIIGFIIVLLGRLYLNNNWDADIYNKKGYKLVMNNIYKYIRHPIYLGQIIMCISTSLILNNWYIVIISLIVIISNVYRALMEEKFLDETYKQEWIKYKKSTRFM